MSIQSSTAPVTDHDDLFIDELFQKQRAAVSQFPSFTASERCNHLKNLKRLLTENIEDICAAISADFGHRSFHETKLLELFPSLLCIRHAIRNLAKWMRPERKKVSIYFWLGQAKVIKQPLGVVGIIVPWNYPLYLAIGPIVSALAAGNRIMIKMSEYSSNFGQLLAHLLGECFTEDHINVINGDVKVAQTFSSLPFDLILFTGSYSVGKKVMTAAAGNLTPVILELGGKSPTIVAPDYSIEAAVKRIILGKSLNAGQTCIAPDYVLLHRSCLDDFIHYARREFLHLYPHFLENEDYSFIINTQHYERLMLYLKDAEKKGAIIHFLAPFTSSSKRLFPPTIVTNVDDSMLIMQEEIFGPLLPIVAYDELNDAIQYVNKRPKPLALYCFDSDKVRYTRLINAIQAGGVTVNDVLCHISQDELPFGGIGPSGMGQYHGLDGFNAFSKRTGVFIQSRLNAVKFLKPPFNHRVINKLINLLLH